MIKDETALNVMLTTIRSFVKDRLIPIEEEVAESDHIPEEIVQEMRDMGLFGLSIPEEYGGLGLTLEEEMYVIMELCKAAPCFRSTIGTSVGIGGMGIVQAVKGYMTVKENAATTQKTQLAMARITREIVDMTDINGTASNTVLAIKNISQVDASNNPVGDRVIGYDASAKAVKIAYGATALSDGDVLIDNVSNLNFAYYAGNATWTPGMDIRLLSAVDVSLTLINPNFTFTTRVVPRNNLNLGGANIPTVTPPIAPRYCFVATAAYGDVNHPMVQIFREFRDRYLMSFSAGRWLVAKYYQHGPAAAGEKNWVSYYRTYNATTRTWSAQLYPSFYFDPGRLKSFFQF